MFERKLLFWAQQFITAGLSHSSSEGPLRRVARAAERICTETTTYVRNIYKYYMAYKLTPEAQEGARKAREAVVPKR